MMIEINQNHQILGINKKNPGDDQVDGIEILKLVDPLIGITTTTLVVGITTILVVGTTTISVVDGIRTVLLTDGARTLLTVDGI